MGFKAQLKVRFSDVDNAGIVYYPRFFHWFHVAYEELFEQRLKVPYPEVLGTDRVGMPAVHVETDFKLPLVFGDVVEIEVLLERLGNKSATFRYLLRRQGDEKVRAEAAITIACIDMDTFQSMPWPEKYRNLFEAYQQAG